jgi:hypothetical protein
MYAYLKRGYERVGCGAKGSGRKNLFLDWRISDELFLLQ